MAEGNEARLEVPLEPEGFILLLSSIDSQSAFPGGCAGDRDSEVGSLVWSHG